ncbi:winged helix-turn-helix transcriptional regulator [Prauserella flavalba]|uniref:HxlR family transcriptional regulator n=1 Tax=Prauserella flavalba TaxID=1477506 RepID=A0A318LQP8_9PSEU|nr:winged helix-turn-helix transcriptional regulator [Prauserella flavalba]PXY23933.1 HxlR family transcriptional regulator [Prauserella flavalba]
MSKREYGQFCGLARASEMLGQRWTLLILRDLLVGPRTYSELVAGLPGIPSNLLATRLKELEESGLIVREARSGMDRSIVYAVTGRGSELQPALDALSRWGAADMHEPREGEIVTEASLVSALRSGIENGTTPEGTTIRYTIRAGAAVAQASVGDGSIAVAPGENPDADLVITAGPGFRDLLAGALDPQAAVDQGLVTVEGDPGLLVPFVNAFVVPYTADTASR